jgi:hypothetical protein
MTRVTYHLVLTRHQEEVKEEAFVKEENIRREVEDIVLRSDHLGAQECSDEICHQRRKSKR